MSNEDTAEVTQDELLRKQVVEYVGQGKADYAQIFTNDKCKVVKADGIRCVQVWVGIPDSVDLPEVDW